MEQQLASPISPDQLAEGNARLKDGACHLIGFSNATVENMKDPVEHPHALQRGSLICRVALERRRKCFAAAVRSTEELPVC